MSSPRHLREEPSLPPCWVCSAPLWGLAAEAVRAQPRQLHHRCAQCPRVSDQHPSHDLGYDWSLWWGQHPCRVLRSYYPSCAWLWLSLWVVPLRWFVASTDDTAWMPGACCTPGDSGGALSLPVQVHVQSMASARRSSHHRRVTSGLVSEPCPLSSILLWFDSGTLSSSLF